MLKKEFHEIFKQSIYFACIVVLLPLFVFITRTIPDLTYIDLLFYFFQAGLIFWPLFMGASLLSSERKQGGIEYLLSLPYSRLQLVWMKFLPRLCAVVIFPLLLIMLYLLRGETYPTAFLVFCPIAYCALFFIALSFSASSDNFVVLSVASLVSIHIYLMVLFLIFWIPLFLKGFPLENFRVLLESHLWRLGLVPFTALFLVMPFIISFVLAFRKYDIRPARIFNKRFFKYFTPLFAFCLIIFFCFIYFKCGEIDYKSYYLTQDHKLIESNIYSPIKIYERDGVIETELKFVHFWPQFDEGKYVYDIYNFSDWITRLDTFNHKAEKIYAGSYERRINWRSWKYGQTIVFLEKKLKLTWGWIVLIDEFSKNVTKIPIDHKPLMKYYRPLIFGTDIADGKRFWLICSERAWENPILRVWEDGRVEDIGESLKTPCYVNKLLITYTDQALVISREVEGRFEIIREMPEWEGFHYQIGHIRTNLGNILLKEIYGYEKTKHRISRMDLETLEIEEIGELKGHLYFFYPGDWYFEERDLHADWINVYQVREDKLQRLKSFPDFDTTKKENFFRLFKGGIILKKNKEVKVYAFPDLKEIKFKGL